jgi:hypothetical protein
LGSSNHLFVICDGDVSGSAFDLAAAVKIEWNNTHKETTSGGGEINNNCFVEKSMKRSTDVSHKWKKPRS